MATDEKAKKYDEALEWMRELYPRLHGATKEDAEHYFPELKESEDERIRKEIISFLQDDIDRINCRVSGDYDDRDEDDIEHQNWCKKAIAYLERQKEQKPSINIDQLKSLMLQYLQEAANKKEDSDIEADTDKWARKILGYDFEQKPVDDKAFEEWIDVWYNEHHRDGYITMDEREFKNFCRGIRNMYQQKPVEWSEEDEKLRKNIIWLLEIHPSYRKEVDWLKSLSSHSHWKPSEEQMEYLSKAILTLGKEGDGKTAAVLNELRKDLKNL